MGVINRVFKSDLFEKHIRIQTFKTAANQHLFVAQKQRLTANKMDFLEEQ
jgi:hypothetical protein